MVLRLVILIAAAFLLAGCATCGSLDIACSNFRNQVAISQPSQFVRDVQADMPLAAPLSLVEGNRADALLDRDLARLVSVVDENGLVADENRAGGDILLLSGGGQWGAFGVGFLGALRESGSPYSPRPRIITGVSTGALQALFLAIADSSNDAADALRHHYLPGSEREVVHRNHKYLTVITGSMAGLRPLRRKLFEALCRDGDGDAAAGCPMIDALASPAAARVYLGFVNARTGDLEYVNVNAMAEQARADGSVAEYRRARDCIAGAALASAAMSAFFQQVRVGGEVYYDGGVRQSLFEAEIGRKVQRAVDNRRKEKSADAQAAMPRDPILYVLRNGPTVVEPAATPGRDALSNALRAEAIVVNQIEVQSIVDLRLERPEGPIWVISADGYATQGGCTKPRGVMFSPEFMRCLMAFGEARALRCEAGDRPACPWRALSEIRRPELEHR